MWKLLRTLLMLLFLGVVPIACCKEEMRDYANVRAIGLTLAESINGVAFTDGTRTTAAELLANIRLEYSYLASVSLGNPFIGSANALQCEEPGGKGLKDRIAALSFTSTGLFNGVAAGQPLDQFVRCSAGKSGYEGTTFPLTQLADSLNTWKSGKFGELNYPIKLTIGPKPADNAQQQFRLRIRLQSGQEIEQTTPRFTWQ
ncbi:hypothetical protein [Hymenobacter glacieicola]|uniref:DUF5034 domain-containing protein n=1 Tax=Hymenobacter glacieicola TaxID=1562124 RepID=A0ABQ1WNC0_9BACT|nr:hypothetical protein [Hymenobacter glacieicola]GGG38542.1 hypothetical protein GCM10011378_13530 [Hymenobacter glacieicola]